MLFPDASDLAIILVILCYSCLSMVFVLTLYANNDFHKLWGFSSFAPFSLGLGSIFYPDPPLRLLMFQYLEVSFLCLMLLLIVLWHWKRYAAGILTIFIFPFAFFFMLHTALPVIPMISANPPPPFLKAGGIAGLSVLLILSVQRVLARKVPYLAWGILFLSTILVLQFLSPALPAGIGLIGRIGAYSLFFAHIFTQIQQVHHAKLRKAEAKLSDLEKTINYEVKKRTLQIERHNEHLLNMVHVDPLVNAYNKKGISNVMKELVEDSKGFTVLLFDLDNFKGINDRSGHLEGDRVLKRIAQIARESIRGFDQLGRYGGDEFLIVLPGASITDAFFVAERFRKRVEAEPNISVSIGVASYPEDGRNIQKVVEVADAGLYESKRKGKNKVTHYQYPVEAGEFV